MKKIIVTLAPLPGETGEFIQKPLNPIEIANDIIASSQAGASMVHLHVTDYHGQPTNDLTLFSHLLDLIKTKSDSIIQGSTGGLSSLSLQERCLAINHERVEVASLNMGSVNCGEGVFINTLPDIRYWANKMQEKKICKELEIFEIGMIRNAHILQEEGSLLKPYYYNFTLGLKGSMKDTLENLFYLKESLPVGATWGFVHHGMEDLSLIAAAIKMGATLVRCGWEDSPSCMKGVCHMKNYEIVKKVVQLINTIGYAVATPDEARELLEIKNPD